MIIIYHTNSLTTLGRGYDNHDQANAALLTMADTQTISTHNLSVADEREIEYRKHAAIMSARMSKSRVRTGVMGK